jgi:CBS domain-containing protein
MAKVNDICERDVIVATEEATVTTAAQLMRKHHVGCIVIVERKDVGLGVPKGIVTDRDLIVEVMAPELDPAVMTVGDIMTRELVTIRADADVNDAMRYMRAKGLRRLPVVTDDGYLIGLVAFDDLLEFVNEELSDLTRTVGHEQARESITRR